jgi:hypothetical protein
MARIGRRFVPQSTIDRRVQAKDDRLNAAIAAFRQRTASVVLFPRPDPRLADHAATDAATEARKAATRLATETHWNTWDAPIFRRQQQAACGAYVDLARFSTEPTCPACRQQLAIYNALSF